jgi:hypothetical protein
VRAFPQNKEDRKILPALEIENLAAKFNQLHLPGILTYENEPNICRGDCHRGQFHQRERGHRSFAPADALHPRSHACWAA